MPFLCHIGINSWYFRLAVSYIKDDNTKWNFGEMYFSWSQNPESWSMSTRQWYSTLHFSFLPFWEVTFSIVSFLFLHHISWWTRVTFHAHPPIHQLLGLTLNEAHGWRLDLGTIWVFLFLYLPLHFLQRERRAHPGQKKTLCLHTLIEGRNTVYLLARKKVKHCFYFASVWCFYPLQAVHVDTMHISGFLIVSEYFYKHTLWGQLARV